MEFHQIFWIYCLAKLKSWLGFGDLDLILKVTKDLGDKFLYPRYLLYQLM